MKLGLGSLNKRESLILKEAQYLLFPFYINAHLLYFSSPEYQNQTDPVFVQSREEVCNSSSSSFFTAENRRPGQLTAAQTAAQWGNQTPRAGAAICSMVFYQNLPELSLPASSVYLKCIPTVQCENKTIVSVSNLSWHLYGSSTNPAVFDNHRQVVTL